ncbi:hypothetical protein B0H19DRAFT_1245805 [Mycena capillaripes]|nr:hypothetical protein B0H19DRAFT_1245805 [Mycena capillaripes]
MPREIRAKNPLLRVYTGRTLPDGYILCSTNLYAPPGWNRADDERPRHGRFHIWTVKNGRIDGIHVDAAAKNQAVLNAPAAFVQLYPTVHDALEYLAHACRRNHKQCRERNAMAHDRHSAGRHQDRRGRLQVSSCTLPRDLVPPEARHLRGDVWAYAVLERLADIPLRKLCLWVVVGNSFITQDRIRAMREFLLLKGGCLFLAMHLHQAILAAVQHDEGKVVVLHNGNIYDDGASNNEELSHAQDVLLEDRLHSRFAEAAIAGQALGGDVWVVAPAAHSVGHSRSSRLWMTRGSGCIIVRSEIAPILAQHLSVLQREGTETVFVLQESRLLPLDVRLWLCALPAAPCGWQTGDPSTQPPEGFSRSGTKWSAFGRAVLHLFFLP